MSAASDSANLAIPAGLPNRALTLGIAMWLICAANGAFAPLFPLYLTGRGMSESNFALVSAIQALVALCVNQAWGYVADRYFRRTALLACMTVATIGAAALLWFLPVELGWIALGVIALAGCSASRGSLLTALCFASRDGARRFSKVRIAGSLGFVVTSFGLGLLADRIAMGAGVMWPAFIVLELGFLATLFFLVDRSPRERHADGTEVQRLTFIRAQRILFGNTMLRRFFWFVLAAQTFHWPIVGLLPKLLTNMGLPNAGAMGAMALGALAEIVVFWFAPQLMARFRTTTLVGVSTVAIAARFLPLAFTDSAAVAIGINVLHLFTFGLWYFAGLHFMHRETPRELQSSGQTVFSIFFITLPLLFGNLLSWWLLHTMSLRHFTAFCAAGALASMLLFIPFKREYDRRHAGATLRL